jgi:hypothetical protein
MTEPSFWTKRKKILTVLGSVIAFISFIANDTFANFKDSITNIENAERSFTVRRQVIIGAEGRSDQPVGYIFSIPAEERASAVQWIDRTSRSTNDLIIASKELAETLPDKARFTEQDQRIIEECDAILHDIHDRQFERSKDESVSLPRLYARASQNQKNAEKTAEETLTAAINIKNRQTKRYLWVKVTSYVLFVLGWSLAFGNKLLSDDAEDDEAI